MDYEKKYKEALERAKYYREGIPGRKFENGENILDYIFPELKESEDDKVRKKLINLVKKSYEQGGYALHKWEADEMLAWLEKQGEKESDPRYENLEEILAADDIYQMSMNDEMVQEAKEKAVNALSGMCIGRLLGLERQGNLTIRFFTKEFEWALGRIIAFWNQNHKDGKYDENELMSYIKVRETELVKLFTDNVCKVSLSDCSEEYRKAYYDGYNKCNRDWLKIKDISVDKYNKNAEILLGGQGEQNIMEMQSEEFDDNIITRSDEILQAISIGLTDVVEDLGWSDFGGLPIEEIQNWLKSLKDRV